MRTHGSTRKVLALIAAVASLSLVLTPGQARGTRTRTTQLAPGVTLTTIRDPRGPWSIRVVRAELSAPSTLEPVLATGKLPGFETTSRMAARYGAIAAINGDYATESGRPVMTFAQDGELAQTALTWGVNFAVNQTETASYIKHVEPELWLHQEDSGSLHPINRWNSGWPSQDQMSLATALGGRDEKPPYNACSARLYATEVAEPSPIRVGVEQTHVVQESACKSGRMFPKKGRVVSALATSPRAGEITSLLPGERVALGWTLGWPDVVETIGGNPTLVREGQIFIEKHGETSFFARHPRTGVGTTASGEVLLVTVDGRQPGYSVGMTPYRFAKLFVSLGANYALNLDGGGSTTMVVNGRIINRVSDGSERPVSSALLLLPGPDPDPRATPAPVPTATPTTSPSVLPTPEPTPTDIRIPPHRVWREIVRDPASTGGLARWLVHEGFYLRGSLGRAARR